MACAQGAIAFNHVASHPHVWPRQFGREICDSEVTHTIHGDLEFLDTYGRAVYEAVAKVHT